MDKDKDKDKDSEKNPNLFFQVMKQIDNSVRSGLL